MLLMISALQTSQRRTGPHVATSFQHHNQSTSSDSNSIVQARNITVHSCANTNTLLPCSLTLRRISTPDSAWSTESVLRKSPSKSLLAAYFLTANKTVYRNSNGTIDVAAATILTQPHLSERFADA